MALLLEQSAGGGLPPGPSKLELSFSLDDPAFASDHFRMYDFKVKRCPRARPHDWTACPFAHPGEKAKRRDPRRYRYSGTACPDFRKTGVCRRGDACPYSHGVFECWLHPSRYRTQMCTDGPSCRRRVCFFAHFEHELRRAEEYPPLLNQQLHAGLVADARALQQQQLAQALSGILGGSAPSLPGGAPNTLEPLMSMQLLKTLSQGTPNALLDSTPTTPTSIAGLSPNSAAAAGAATAGLNDSSKLLLQLQLLQQQQAGGAAAVVAAAGLRTAVSDASQQSGSSPGGSPRMTGAAATDLLGTPTHAAAEAARQGSSPTMVSPADEASQLARLIQQQQAAQAAAVAGGIDPALLAALQNLGLGAQPDAAGSLNAAGLGIGGLARRSIDNSALTRQFSQPAATNAAAADNYLAAAAAALASGNAVGNLASAGSGGVPAPAGVLPGSLPTQSYVEAAAALARGGGQPPSPSAPCGVEDDRTLSLDQILAELPRSASQSGSPQLGRILGRTGSAEAVCRALKGGANGAGGTARDGFSALHVACACGWDDLIEELLKAGVLDVDVLSRELYTPLMLAAMCGHARAVRLLLGRGAQLGRRSRRGATAIALAAQSAGSLSALHALLEHPSCTPRLVRQLGFRQRSPLVLSVMSHGSPAVVRALLGAGADPSEACTARGSVSVLHTCAHLARVEAMRELIAAGARVNAEAQGGTTVLQEVFVQPPSRQRPEAAKRDMFRMLVAAGADVNYRSPHQSFTVLHFALASCREEATANIVLDSGADLSIALNQPLRLGEANEWLTMLHVACVHGWSRLAERLVQAGADLTSRNKDGMQPIHTAVLGCHEGIVQVLLRCGADPLATCPDCYPSLAVWKMRRYVRALQAMVQPEHGAEAFPALADLLNLGTAAEGGPHLTAVDLAACVARHIPTLEAFLERGVRPSPEALALAEHSVPLLRAVVERPLLTPELAARLPPRFRAAARETLLCLSRPVVTPDGRQVALPPDAVAAVLQQAAFPVSPWASPSWLAAQKVREPAPRVGARGGQQAQQGGAAPGPAGAAALPPGVHVLGPGEQPPPFVQAMVNEMQQHFGEVGAQPHFIVVHQQQGEAPPGGPADVAGDAANAAGGAGGAAGVADAAAQAQGAPGQHVHVMQIPLGPGGLPAGPAAAAGGAQGGPALPPCAPGLPGFMQDFMEGMLAGMAHAAGAGAPPGGFPRGPLPFPFGGGPLVFEEEMWDSDDDDELDDEDLGFNELDDSPDLHWQPGAPQGHGPAPAAPLPGPPPPEAAAVAPPEGSVSADGGGETSSRAAPAAPGDALGSDDVAGPSTSGASGPGKRPASGSATFGRSSQGYDLRDRSKRQRGQ